MNTQGLIRIALAVLLALAVAGLVLATDRPRVRYTNYNCQYDLIFNQSGPVDLAVIGSSRSLQGVDAPVLAEVLDVPVVYNLAKNWRGQGINYAIMSDLLARREVDTVLVEANLPESGTFHAHFFLVGTTGDWMRSLGYRSDGLFDFEEMGRNMKWMVDRVTEQASLFVAGKLNMPARASASASGETGYCRTREETVRESFLEAQRAQFSHYYEGRTWRWDPLSQEARHDTGFYRAMADLAEAHGVELVFYHINQAYYFTLDPNFAVEFEAVVGAPILIPPPSLTREIEAMGGYADATHMTREGRERYSRWLAAALAEQLGRDVSIEGTNS